MLQAVEALMDVINDKAQAVDKTKLHYVNKFNGKAKKIGVDQFTWVMAEEDYGMSPIVAPLQNTPIVGQGDYTQYLSSAIETRHAKVFTREQLQAILSPDKKYRIPAAEHVERESINMVNRILSTIEFAGHSCMARGQLRYTNNDGSNRMKVEMDFPIKLKTAGATWANAATDIMGHVQAWLDEYALSGNGTPDVIRMTTNVWKWIRDNTAIKAYIVGVMRLNATELQTSMGIITPTVVSAALGWPPIQIYDERASLKFTSTATLTAGNTKVLTLAEGTFGLNIGDKVLIRYDNGSWGDEATITNMVHGVSVTLGTIAAGISPGDVIVAKPNYFPVDRVLLVKDEDTQTELIRTPFGITADNGELKLTDWYGVRVDAFMSGSEPNRVVMKRAWDKFGWRFNPRKIMSCKVIL